MVAGAMSVWFPVRGVHGCYGGHGLEDCRAILMAGVVAGRTNGGLRWWWVTARSKPKTRGVENAFIIVKRCGNEDCCACHGGLLDGGYVMDFVAGPGITLKMKTKLEGGCCGCWWCNEEGESVVACVGEERLKSCCPYRDRLMH